MSNQLAEAARQYLIATAHLGACPGTRDVLDAAIAAHEDSLREKAAKPAEPVAWRYKYKFHDIGETGAYEYHSHDFACVARLPKGEPLSAAPVAVASPWIPVSERLPEPDTGEVLVWLDGGRCAFDEWHTHREDPIGMSTTYTLDMGCMWRDFEFDEITHWQPLPPAPETKP